jgi:hypothetical protein
VTGAREQSLTRSLAHLEQVAGPAILAIPSPSTLRSS